MFNSADLKISDVSVQSEALKTEQVQACSETIMDKDMERVCAKFQNALPKGSKAKLNLKWEGNLQANMLGGRLDL